MNVGYIKSEFEFLTNNKPWLRNMVMRVVEDKKFIICSGSGENGKHHYGDHGLLIHTYEVATHALTMATQHKNLTGDELKIDELFVAAVWHDYGKVWDYTKMNSPSGWGKWDTHARRIHHISRSAIEWNKWVDDKQVPDDFDVDHVTHMILSHHGCREWGSPVSPATQEAWILHLADNLSARLNDCYTPKRF